VEDVKSASADVEFMDYVGTGQVIKLEPSDVLVLSYLKSCEHETITGGTVRVGSSFRLQNASFEPTVYALPPVIQIPKIGAGESRTLVIERKNRPSERFAIELDASLANGGFYDLAKTDARLRRGAFYTATLGSRTLTFKVDAKAKTNTKTGKTPVVSRLIRFPPG
jgi:hypothetical protein